MTAQLAERLRYEGQDLAMCTNPLSDYFAMGGANPGFVSSCTALWRGYVGSWEIIAGRLYLTSISGTIESGSEASLTTIFPDSSDRVFAHWYSGRIRIPQGKQLEYVHMGYASIFERDLFLDLERGVVKNTYTCHNGKAESETDPKDYEV